MTDDMNTENRDLRAASAVARKVLAETGARLRAIILDEAFLEETPIEVTNAMELALEAIDTAIAKLTIAQRRKAVPPGHPTRQQGQFLAFLREYMLRNHFGVVPTHADLQQFFNLTAPSVNSMLVRLERRGFIRRIPHQARGIELTVTPDWIPALDRPFKLR